MSKLDDSIELLRQAIAVLETVSASVQVRPVSVRVRLDDGQVVAASEINPCQPYKISVYPDGSMWIPVGAFRVFFDKPLTIEIGST